MISRRRWPWLLGFGLLLLVELPVFVRMPLWVDATLYDVSAWTMLNGGLPYRDVFDTNLPGMPLLHLVVRSVFGFSHEALRCADLLVFAGIIALLSSAARRAGVGFVPRFWLAFACCHFYLMEGEFSQVQRDTWMLLPSLAAFACRAKRFNADAPSSRSNRWAWREGVLWGAAIWIKPHVVVPMVFLWLQGLGWRLRAGRRRELITESLAQLAGLMLVGGVGLTLIAVTGTWGPMWEVMLHWNGEYYDFSATEYLDRLTSSVSYFDQWSLVHFVAIPLAAWNVLFRYSRDSEGVARASLDALYLGWLAQATLLQKTFAYAHAPAILLALASLTARRWPAGPVVLGWSVAGTVVWFAADQSPRLRNAIEGAGEINPVAVQQIIPFRDYANIRRLDHWAECWQADGPPNKTSLSHYANNFAAPDWAELKRVENFLREREVGDGEVLAWDDTTHPLYLALDIRPAIPYQHVMTALQFISKRPLIRDQTNNCGAKFIVSDMLVPYTFAEGWPDNSSAPRLPRNFPDEHRNLFPWNQPILFRTRRFVVHKFEHPITDDLPLSSEVPLRSSDD